MEPKGDACSLPREVLEDLEFAAGNDAVSLCLCEDRWEFADDFLLPSLWIDPADGRDA
jgi:hypothetical protein